MRPAHLPPPGPAGPDPRVERARSLIQLRRPAQARDLLGEALAEDPDSPDATLLYATTLLALDDPVGAVDWCDRTVRLEPDSATAHRVRSQALTSAGRHAEAERAARVSLRLEPDDAASHRALAAAYAAQPSQLVRAAATAEEAIRLDPGSPSAHFLAARIAQSRGDEVAAAAAYRRVLALDPNHAPAHNNLALLSPSTSHRSAEGYAAALAADPTLGVARSNLERTLVDRHLVACGAVLAGLVAATVIGGLPGGVVAMIVSLLFVPMLGLVGLRRERRSVRLFRPVVLGDVLGPGYRRFAIALAVVGLTAPGLMIGFDPSQDLTLTVVGAIALIGLPAYVALGALLRQLRRL